MYEGPRNNYLDEEDNLEDPFDYLKIAEQERLEREAKAAAEKAEKEAKEKKRREERVAKQLARSAAKREEMAEKAADKAKDLEESTEKAKEQVAEVKQEVEQIKQASAPAEKDVEMTATEGSEYVAELANGEGATLKFVHDTKELEKSVDDADEAIKHADDVSARAAAIARARDAIDGVEPGDMHQQVLSGESVPVNDLGDVQRELHDRIQHTWDHDGVDAETAQMGAPASDELASTGGSSSSEVSGDYSYGNGRVERAPDPVSPVTTTLKNGAAYVGGFLAGRSRMSALKRSLDKTSSSLRRETTSIARDVETIQRQSAAHEFMVPKQVEVPTATVATPRIESAPIAEVHGTDAPAIPEWIRQVERDVKNGKVAELKKWQYDILRIQHPDLLTKYEKLDTTLKETIKSQSKEVLSQQFVKPAPLSMPGDLPMPVSSMPAYMSAPAQPLATTPAYDYASVSSGASSSVVTANGYLIIVLVGGILFGALLIAVFGF